MTLIKELRRQGMHALLGTVLLLMVYFLGVPKSFLVAVAALVIGLVISSLIYRGVKLPIICHFVKTCERGYEKHFPGRGALLFLTSFILVMVIFYPFPTVILGAMCVLIYGDSASTIFGKSLGKHKIGRLSLEGSLGGMLIASIALLFLFPFYIAIPVAIVGMLAEYLPLDDNFTIPLVSAFFLTITPIIVL